MNYIHKILYIIFIHKRNNTQRKIISRWFLLWKNYNKICYIHSGYPISYVNMGI